MRLATLFPLALIAITATLAPGQTPRSTSGIWKLNVQKSKLPNPILSAVKIEEALPGNAARDTIEFKMPQGRTRLVLNPFVAQDGREHPLEQTTITSTSDGKQEITALSGITCRWELIDAQHSRVTMRKKEGSIGQVTERTLSEDGSELRVEQKFPDGRPGAVYVWDRHSNGQ